MSFSSNMFVGLKAYNFIQANGMLYYYEKAPLRHNRKTHRVRFTQTFSGGVRSNQTFSNPQKADNLVVKFWPNNSAKKAENAIKYEQRFGQVEATDQHSYMITSDYGMNIRDFFRNNFTLSMEKRIEIIQALLAKLNELEQAGILHRNLKAENIFVRLGTDFLSHEVNITGFEFATPHSDTKVHGENSIGYASPDKKITHASDRFVLGPIIGIILGCHPDYMLRSRREIEKGYDRLSPDDKDKFDVSTLPAYDFSSLPTNLFPENSKIRRDLLKLLNQQIHEEPEMRHSLNFLNHFFSLIKQSLLQEANKSLFRKGAEITGNLLNNVDHAFERGINYMDGSKVQATSRPIVKDPLDYDFLSETEKQMRQSPEYLMDLIGQHRKKFEGTRSTGILEFFEVFDRPSSFNERLQTMGRIGEEKQNPGCWTGLMFCLFYTPRNLNIDDLYQDYALLRGLNIRDNRKTIIDTLSRIEQKMARRVFVNPPQQVVSSEEHRYKII